MLLKMFLCPALLAELDEEQGQPIEFQATYCQDSIFGPLFKMDGRAARIRCFALFKFICLFV